MSEEAKLDGFAEDAERKLGQKNSHEQSSSESRFWGAIPEGWELVDGLEVYDVNPNPKSDEEPNTYIEMDALDTELPWPRYFGERDASEYSGKTFTAGDTLFARITPCTENGKAALVPEMDTRVGVGSTEYAVLSPKVDRILPWYLYYIAKSHPVHDYAISRMRGSTGRQRVPFSVFRRELDVVLPPLEEQHKIASILYNVDQAIQKTKKLGEQAERVKKGLAQELIHTGIGNPQSKSAWMGKIPEHWGVREFSEIVEFSQNGIYKNKDDYGGPYPIIKMGDIFGGVMLDVPVRERVQLDDDEIAKYATAEEDLVFARHAQAGWGAGDCTFVPEMDETAVVESNMVHVRLNDEVDPLFYAQYFNSEIGVKSIKRITTTGNIKSISQGDLMSLKVPVPPREEQDSIAKTLSGFDEQAEYSTSEVNRLRRLKQGLMQDLLSGTVRTTDTNILVLDEVAQYG